MKTSERCLSVEEIAGHLGASKETIYRWLDRKKIPVYRLGKLWKFRARELDVWVKKGGASKPAAARRYSSSTEDRRGK